MRPHRVAFHGLCAAAVLDPVLERACKLKVEDFQHIILILSNQMPVRHYLHGWPGEMVLEYPDPGLPQDQDGLAQELLSRGFRRVSEQSCGDPEDAGRSLVRWAVQRDQENDQGLDATHF